MHSAHRRVQPLPANLDDLTPPASLQASNIVSDQPFHLHGLRLWEQVAIIIDVTGHHTRAHGIDTQTAPQLEGSRQNEAVQIAADECNSSDAVRASSANMPGVRVNELFAAR